MRRTLDLTQETDQLVLWRKLTRALRHLLNENKKSNKLNYTLGLETINSANSLNQKGRKGPPVTREETCQGDCEGSTTHAVVAPRSKVPINIC